MSGQKEKFEQHVRKMENAEMENKKEGGQQGVSKFYIDFSNVELENLETKRFNRNSMAAGSGCLTIVSHRTCGIRLHLANQIWRDLGCPQFVKLCIAEKKLLVFAGDETDIAVKFNHSMEFGEAVKSYMGKVVLYASATVKRLVKMWNLEREEGCCFTGGEYDISEFQNSRVVVIVFNTEVTSVSEQESTDTIESEQKEIAHQK